MGETRDRHSFRPLLFVPPQGPDALPPTIREARPAPAPLDAGESHMRLRALPANAIDCLDAQYILDELGEEQLALGVGLSGLEQSVAFVPRSPAVHAALVALERRIGCIAALHDALAVVHLAAIDRRVQRLFVADSVLADYLRGLYAWGHAAVRALEQVAMSLRARRRLDWALLRFRLDEAKNFHFDDLDVTIRADLASLPPVAGREELACAVEELFVTARTLEARLDERMTSGA